MYLDDNYDCLSVCLSRKKNNVFYKLFAERYEIQIYRFYGFTKLYHFPAQPDSKVLFLSISLAEISKRATQR